MSNQAAWNMSEKCKKLIDQLARADANASIATFVRRAQEVRDEFSEANRDEGSWECGYCTATFATADERDDHMDRKHLHGRYSPHLG